MNKIHLIAAALSVALVGCGGSSDSVDSAAKSTPSSLNLTLTSQSCDGTSVPMENASVLLHDQNGAIIETLFSDSEGRVEKSLDENVKHLSIIQSTVNEESGRRDTNIRSFVNFHGDDINNVNFFQSCYCANYRVNTSEINATHPGYTLKGFSAGSEQTVTSHISVCDHKPVTVVLASPDGVDVRAAVIQAPADIIEVIELSESQFVHQGVLVDVPVNEGYSVRAQTNKDEDMVARTSFDFGGYIFPTLGNNHFVYQRHSNSVTTSAVDFSILVNAVAKSRVNTDGSVASLKYPVDLQESFSSAATLVLGDSDSYDFSYLANDFSELNVYVSLEDSSSNDTVAISLSAPLSGVTPEFDYGSIVNGFEGELESFQVGIIGYENAPKGLNEFRKFVKQRSLSNTAYDNYRGLFITGFPKAKK